MVIDVSGSMTSNSRLQLARDAAFAVLDTLTWNDEIGFILFGTVVYEVYPITYCTDENRTLMQTWLTTHISARGLTNFIAPLERAFDMIESSTTSACTKAILFLTDGDAEFNEDNYEYVEEKCTDNNVVMFTYALGSGKDTFYHIFRCLLSDKLCSFCRRQH